MTEVDHILRNVDKGKHLRTQLKTGQSIITCNTDRSGHIWPNFRPHLHTIHVDDDYGGEYILLDISVAV